MMKNNIKFERMDKNESLGSADQVVILTNEKRHDAQNISENKIKT
jgi:hypothetical protein